MKIDNSTGKFSSHITPSFTGRRYWLCGASTGMGLAIANELCSRGAKVILMSRGIDKLEEAKKQLGEACLDIVSLDISAPDSAEKAARIAKMYEPLDGVLLNGGGPHGGKSDSLKWDDFDEAHRILLAGPANLLLALLPYLNSPASVVSIGSTTIKEPNPNLPLSATYRLGLVAFLKNLANTVGPKQIRINTVAPGYTSTDKLNELADYVSQSQSLSRDDVYRLWAAQSPLQRIASPEEIAKVCAFLFSDDSSYISGQTILVDGGMMRGY